MVVDMETKPVKIDSDNGPGTIESEDEIENFSGSDSESEDEVIKRQKLGGVTDFYKDFDFVQSVRDYHKDSWNSVLEYIKVPKERGLNEKILRIHQEEARKEKLKSALEEDPVKSEKFKDDIENELKLPKATKKDDLKVREIDLLRKEKQKLRPEKDTRTKEQIAIDEENAKFFEDAPPVDLMSTFLEMNLSRALLKAIDSLGYETPTPIQSATIPVALLGRDICGCAATGTGKTAAFMLPILERLIFKPPEDAVTRVLVLLPTRELCVQVFQVTKELSKYTSVDVALSVGGLDLRTQVARLKSMPDVVIATPGRLLDHLKNTPGFGIDGVEILVLDEADRLLDEHFEEQMKDVINQCSQTRQTMLFSATMTDKVQRLALVALKNPVKVFVDSNTDVARNLRQEFVRLRNEDNRLAVLAYLLAQNFSNHTMVFVPRKYMCHKFVIILGFLGVKAGELHANLKQAERLLSLQKFKEGENGVLIATDVAARGLDIQGVRTVINYMLPHTYSSYVHRVGRTARAGHGGRSISLATDNEYNLLKQIKKSSKSALYERVIDKDVISNYKLKLQKIKPMVAKVVKEEIEEKRIAEMEKQVSKLQDKLSESDRKNSSETPWHKDDIGDKQFWKHMRKQGKQLGPKIKKQKGQVSENPGEDRRIKSLQKHSAKRAKKSMKNNRIASGGQETYDVEKEVSKPNTKKKRQGKKKSSFESELTRTDTKSVKKFRYGPSYEEKKEEFEKKNPGKKYKPVKRKI